MLGELAFGAAELRSEIWCKVCWALPLSLSMFNSTDCVRYLGCKSSTGQSPSVPSTHAGWKPNHKPVVLGFVAMSRNSPWANPVLPLHISLTPYLAAHDSRMCFEKAQVCFPCLEVTVAEFLPKCSLCLQSEVLLVDELPEVWSQGHLFLRASWGLQSFNYSGPTLVNYSPSWAPLWVMVSKLRVQFVQIKCFDVQMLVIFPFSRCCYVRDITISLFLISHMRVLGREKCFRCNLIPIYRQVELKSGSWVSNCKWTMRLKRYLYL